LILPPAKPLAIISPPLLDAWFFGNPRDTAPDPAKSMRCAAAFDFLHAGSGSPLSRQFYLLAKRAFDLVAAATGVVLVSPLLLLIAVLVKLDSPGPVIYLGPRIGKDGKPFNIYKFRSMVANAEQLGTTATAHLDPRITRVGRFIRRYKLDELPQLFNVLAGDMSFVGPRPEVEEHTSCYSEEEKGILSVKPGITDFSSIRFVNLNQLLGTENANQVFIEKYRAEKNRLRLEYVRKQSFASDMRILAHTAWLIFTRPLRKG
jgi:lipopolysaccharide/colanic/teichoic acid biosynthesis glycosyltransferase